MAKVEKYFGEGVKKSSIISYKSTNFLILLVD